MLRRSAAAAAMLRRTPRTFRPAAQAVAPQKPQWEEIVTEAMMETDFQNNAHYTGVQPSRDLETPILIKAFARFDLDRNMILDRNEVTAMLEHFNIDSSPKTVDEVFQKLDTNQDGVISLLEWVKGSSGVGLKTAVLAAAQQS